MSKKQTFLRGSNFLLRRDFSDLIAGLPTPHKKFTSVWRVGHESPKTRGWHQKSENLPLEFFSSQSDPKKATELSKASILIGEKNVLSGFLSFDFVFEKKQLRRKMTILKIQKNHRDASQTSSAARMRSVRSQNKAEMSPEGLNAPEGRSRE